MLVAAFAAPTLDGEWFPARHLMAAFPIAAALAAWGLRHAPRTGAVLGALTLLCSAWLVIALAFGSADGWVHPGVDAPYGPGVGCCRGSGIRRRTSTAAGRGGFGGGAVMRGALPPSERRTEPSLSAAVDVRRATDASAC